jgi:ribose transport system permease protein
MIREEAVKGAHGLAALQFSMTRSSQCSVNEALLIFQFWWAVASGALGALVLRRTPFGKAVLATGGNEVAARYSGISTRRINIAVLASSSGVGALAGLLYVGQFGSGRYDLGSGDLLTVLAAVVIGGTSLSGGRGSVEGAIAGALLVGLVNNGVILLGFSTPEQQIFSGIIIVVAVALSGHRLGQLRLLQ